MNSGNQGINSASGTVYYILHGESSLRSKGWNTSEWSESFHHWQSMSKPMRGEILPFHFSEVHILQGSGWCLSHQRKKTTGL